MSEQRRVLAMADPQTDPLARLAEAVIWKLRKDQGEQVTTLELVANAMLEVLAMALANPEGAAQLVVEHCPSDEFAQRLVHEQGAFLELLLRRMRPSLHARGEQRLRVVH